MGWTVRFRGRDERETLARADAFFLGNEESLGLLREEFFARLVLSEDGTEAVFVDGPPLERPFPLEPEEADE